MSLPRHIQKLSAVHVDNPNEPRRIGRRQELSIRAHRHDRRLLRDFCQSLSRTRRYDPVPGEVVQMSGRHARPTREQCQVADFAGRIDSTGRRSICEIPESNGLVCRRRCQTQTVRQKDNRPDRRGMSSESQTGLTRFSIPQTDDVVRRGRRDKCPVRTRRDGCHRVRSRQFQLPHVARSPPQLDGPETAGCEHVSGLIERQRLNQVLMCDPRSGIG